MSVSDMDMFTLGELTDIIIEGTGAAEAVYCWGGESSL